jgi:hypothetical protein
VNGHESAAAEIAAAGMRYGQCIAHRYRGINGIASLAQNGGAHLGGQMLRRDHHSLVRFEFEGRGRLSGQARREQQGEGDSVHGP